MRSPKTIKGQKIIKVLVKNGYEIKRQRGSHVSLSKGKVLVTVVMPFTTIGVYKNISKITGIPQEEFY